MPVGCATRQRYWMYLSYSTSPGRWIQQITTRWSPLSRALQKIWTIRYDSGCWSVALLHTWSTMHRVDAIGIVLDVVFPKLSIARTITPFSVTFTTICKYTCLYDHSLPISSALCHSLHFSRSFISLGRDAIMMVRNNQGPTFRSGWQNRYNRVQLESKRYDGIHITRRMLHWSRILQLLRAIVLLWQHQHQRQHQQRLHQVLYSQVSARGLRGLQERVHVPTLRSYNI